MYTYPFFGVKDCVKLFEGIYVELDHFSQQIKATLQDLFMSDFMINYVSSYMLSNKKQSICVRNEVVFLNVSDHVSN